MKPVLDLRGEILDRCVVKVHPFVRSYASEIPSTDPCAGGREFGSVAKCAAFKIQLWLKVI